MLKRPVLSKSGKNSAQFAGSCANAAKTSLGGRSTLTEADGGLERYRVILNYFDGNFRQLTTAITIPISAVIGPAMDQVVVLLIWLP